MVGCFPRIWHFFSRVVLSRVFDEVIEVNLIDSVDYIHLAFLKRPELGVTLTKLHCWTLTHYSKCVFLDADTLVSTREGKDQTLHLLRNPRQRPCPSLLKQAASSCWWIPTR